VAVRNALMALIAFGTVWLGSLENAKREELALIASEFWLFGISVFAVSSKDQAPPARLTSWNVMCI
jgi:hypothetical protein